MASSRVSRTTWLLPFAVTALTTTAYAARPEPTWSSRWPPAASGTVVGPRTTATVVSRPGERRDVDVELRPALLRHHEGEVGDLLSVDEHHAAVLAGLGYGVHH